MLLPDAYPDLFRTPLTPKSQEIIAYYGKGKRKVQKPPEWYEDRMRDAFAEMRRVLSANGVVSVSCLAHKTASAWESLIAGLMRSGLVVTASWPLHTEMATRLVARNTAALASSVTLVCRGRGESTGSGLWDDVRQELKTVAQERLDYFWKQGIRGADFFISAIRGRHYRSSASTSGSRNCPAMKFLSGSSLTKCGAWSRPTLLTRS